MHKNSTILLIGSGRLAKHLQYWNSLLETPNRLLQWDRSQDPQLLLNFLVQTNSIWLAISDAAIKSFYETYLINFKHKVVHFSGAFNNKRFLCAHPLMSFPNNFLPEETYKKIHFVISGFDNLNEVLPNFNNKFTILSSANKSYYHALCVLAGNFPQMIWNEVSLQMKQLNLPTEAFDLYVKQITDNYLELKEKAITGPLIRKDYTTIEKNISSLEQSHKLKNIYSALMKEFTQ